jgi:hypothetical protein
MSTKKLPMLVDIFNNVLKFNVLHDSELGAYNASVVNLYVQQTVLYQQFKHTNKVLKTAQQFIKT